MHTPSRIFSSWRYSIAPLLLTLAISGCGDGGGGDKKDLEPDADISACGLAGSGVDNLTLAGACDQKDLLGTILLEALDDFSLLDAKVSNAVLPSSVREEELSMAGCRLMRKSFPFCDPACQPNEACTFSGECIAYPTRQDLGDICVAGLSESVVMTAEAPDYGYFNTQLENPAFTGGERLEVHTTVGAYPAFDLEGVGVTKMKSDEQWTIVPGDDLAISWSTSDKDANAMVELTINIDQHGSSPLLLECDFPDTGEASIPSDLLMALLTSGVSGFPVGKISRHTSDSVEVSDGCIEFVVRSPQTVDVRVEGHVPCTGVGVECPKGTTCNVPLQTCE